MSVNQTVASWDNGAASRALTSPAYVELVRGWQATLRDHDLHGVTARVRSQSTLPLLEMVALDETLSNPFPQPRPCFRLLAAYLTAWYASLSADSASSRQPALSRTAPRLGIDSATLGRALSGQASMQRETAIRLYAQLHEQGVIRPEHIDDELVRGLWASHQRVTAMTARSRPLSKSRREGRSVVSRSTERCVMSEFPTRKDESTHVYGPES